MWVTLDDKSRFNSEDRRLKLTTVEKNRECLNRTIKKFRKEKPTCNFVVNLNKFIEEIRTSIKSESYKITKPNIYPEPKEIDKRKKEKELQEKGYNEYRPISRFILRDRIILSITNKFFTNLFDKYFEDSSLAFRMVKKVEGKRVLTNHHTAINKIKDFKKIKYPETPLYVAECDMKKFYDSVNHKICLTAFNKLIEKTKDLFPNLDLILPINVFEEYLRFYSFQDVILPLNDDKDYWKNRNILSGKFAWIEDDIKKSNYYLENDTDRIGVPQGGALSGLIANIVLDEADKKLKDIANIFYVRYCDDMIICHPNNEICKASIDLYIQTIQKLHLFPHPLCNDFIKKRKISEGRNKKLVIAGKVSNKYFENSIKSFWKAKSKGPYKWGCFHLEENSFPWIGFVGYEIHHNGNTRVRIKSLKKELRKQDKVINEIIKAIKIKKVIKNDSILKSATEKLNGMSIGRVELHNYKTCISEMCWTKGFKELSHNKHSIKQLKLLDRNKNKVISVLRFKIGADITKKNLNNDDNNPILQYNKPFSYYYQAGERNKTPIIPPQHKHSELTP